MATIASLAVRLTANIDQFEKNFKTVSTTVESLAKKTAAARPSVKSLMDAAEGYAQVLQSAAKAESMLKTAEVFDEQREALSQTVAVAEDLKTRLQSFGEQVPKDMFNMNPTLENVQKARREIEKMIALKAELESKGQDTALFGNAIENMQKGLAEFSNKAIQAQAETQMLRTTLQGINGVPFIVLGNVFTEVVTGMKNFMKEFNESFGGMPAKIMTCVAVVGALAIGIRLLYVKTMALGVSISFFMTLWKSSVIYQGLQGIVALLNTMLGVQLALNIATGLWIGMITLGIGVLIAGIVSLIASWNDHSAAINESKASMDALAKSTDKVRERWNELNNQAKIGLESLMTPAEKLAEKLKEIDSMQTKDVALKAQIKRLNERNQDLAKMMEENRGWLWDGDYVKALQAEFDSNHEKLQELYSDAKGMVKMTEEQIAALKENARIEMLQDVYGDLLQKTVSVQEHYNTTMAAVAADLEAGQMKASEAAAIQENLNQQLRDKLGMKESDSVLLERQLDLLAFAFSKSAITQEEYADKVKEAMEKWDPATIAAVKAAEALAKEQEKLAAEHAKWVEKFSGMGEKSPLETFHALSAELAKVKNDLKPGAFASALEKMRSDLASGLGLSQYLDPKTAMSMDDVLKSLADHADELGLSQQALAEAQDRARAAFEKQSEMYSLYQKAQDAMLTPQQRLAETFAKIDAEAQKFGWSSDVMKKMKEMAEKDMMGSGGSTGESLADQFRSMIPKTAIESFKELSVELASVRNELSAAEFKAAKDKLLADLASGLGIAEYLKDALTPSQQLREIYRNLETYAREARLTDAELNAAKRRAKDALMKQSEYYSLYQKAQDSMLTAQQKLQQELTRITQEARMWGWDRTVVDRMKQLINRRTLK